MNKLCLLKKLEEIGIPPRYYSIDGHLSSDTHILNQVYERWEYFYFDEKGNKNNFKSFDSENDACMYLLNVLKDEINLSPKNFYHEGFKKDV